MKNKFMKGFSLVLASSLLMTNVAYAQEANIRKNETIYVTKEADKIKDKTGSIWINSDNNIKAKDKTNLKNIKNLKMTKKLNLKMVILIGTKIVRIFITKEKLMKICQLI